MNDNELCDKSTGNADNCAPLRTLSGQAEPVDAESQTPLRGRPGIIDLLAKVGGSLPELDRPITEAATQTGKTMSLQEWANYQIERRNKMGNAPTPMTDEEYYRSCGSGHYGPSVPIDFARDLERQLAEARKQVEWKQHRVEVLQRVGRKIVAERDEARATIADVCRALGAFEHEGPRLAAMRVRAERDEITSVEGGGK